MAQITATRRPAVDLPEREAEAWRTLQRDEPAFANPLMGPDFARAVGQVRPDAEVVVYRDAERIVGFLGLHRRPGGFARPLGAPFADYHALVSLVDPGFDGAQALRLAEVRAFRHIGLVDPHGLFPSVTGQVTAHHIQPDADPEAYLERLRAGSPKKFKNYRRLLNRLAEAGPLRFQASGDAADLDRVLRWKSEQFVRTGLQDVLRPRWVQALMHSLFDMAECKTGDFHGLLLTLHAGEVLVGGHFGVACNGVFHPWIASTNPDLAHVSPGNAFLDRAIRAMPALGLTVYDLGPGHDHYKRPFASGDRTVGVGLTLADARHRPLFSAVDWASGGTAPLDKVRRRLDHIAAVEPDTAGRALALVEAVRAIPRRFGPGTPPEA